MKSIAFVTRLIVLSLLFFGNKANATVGAETPFTSVEAESGLLGGGATIVSLTALLMSTRPAITLLIEFPTSGLLFQTRSSLLG